jgi:hypothetical protein
MLGKWADYFGVGVAIGLGIESFSLRYGRRIDPDTDSDSDADERKGKLKSPGGAERGRVRGVSSSFELEWPTQPPLRIRASDG